MENSDQTIKIIGALAIGAIAGAIFGVLFAPDKGCKTRSKLSGKMKRDEEELLKRMKEDVIAFRNRADEIENQIK